MPTAAKTTFVGRIDLITLLLYFALVAVGLSAVFSVEYHEGMAIFDLSTNHTKQMLFFGISLFVGLVILFTDSKFFSSFAFLSYLGGVLLLILTIFIAHPIKGSRSWINAGIFSFQPGEVCKIFTSLALSKFLSLPETNFKTWKARGIALALALVPAIIIIKQNETGLALVYFTFILVMYREGLPGGILIAGFALIALMLATLLVDRKVLLILLTCIAVLAALIARKQFMKDGTLRAIIIGSYLFALGFSGFAVPLAFKKVLHQYQIERIYNTLGKDVPKEYQKEADEEEEDAPAKKKDSNYNVQQSKIAIGSGGLLGKGFLNGTSTKNNFVPEQHTDFIFCSIGEQFGFLGSAVLIILYLTLMMRIVILAERQRSQFSRVYAYCVAAIIFFHFAVNISMTIGLAPVIGITLPFLSYGGSSLVTFSILLFILIRLDVDRQVSIR